MYNKVEYNGETLINLTDTTATENDVVQGKKFHDRSGALRDGNLVIPTYTAGDGIDITNGEISAKVDGTTIQTNENGELEVNEDEMASKTYVNNGLSGKADKVDMPIIETITLEEEVAQVARTYTESQNFTDCIILIEFPQVTTNITFNSVITTNTYYPANNSYYNNGISSAGKRYYQIHSNMINGYRYTTQRQSTVNTKDTFAALQSVDFEGLYLYPERYTKITRISVSAINANLPIGTKITILGKKDS